MKFREFRRFTGKTINDLFSWAMNDLNSVMRELFIGLNHISFQDNLHGYEVTVTLAASEERQIGHPIGSVPSGYLIFKQQGNGVIDAGLTDWTTQVVYLRNNSGSNSVKVTAIFFP